MKKPLIILTGPTAVGKTKLSIKLARAVNGEIISADSMQIYRYMDIGSAKIRPEEMEEIPHHLVDCLDPDEEFNVVRFQKMAKEAMEDIYARNRIPLLVGGTGFYIQAVTGDIDFTECGEDNSYRKELEKKAKEQGAKVLHRMLSEVDPESALAIHANNTKRVIRALEYYQQTGEPISLHNQQQRQKESPYNLAYFVLNDERSRLYKRIDARIDEMLREGLVDEVKHLQQMGYHKGMVSMQGLGYKEILSYLDGTWSLEEAVYILKRDTRHFAKRQITWFKRERNVEWFHKPDYDYDENKILEGMLQSLRSKSILPQD
ncbi:tRNA (adenosine(37)-N6)-dimethylallyltransferase MiaA [bacterium]|nr:tRNA (adenosine(37)-N6)-dimethylallyltransferase MiaA [bacterium]MDY3021624.1 tRNA (adenosine(37)-N6)-dimethylallyltransferase MiaA [Oliverpabstia sp.]